MTKRGKRDRPNSDPSPLLLASGLQPEQAGEILARYGIADSKRADANLQSMAGEPRSRELLASVLGDLLDAVAKTADPDQALTHWERYVEAAGNRVPLFQYLCDSPRQLHLLCTIFGNSPALAETLIRDPRLMYWLAEEEVLSRRPSRKQLARALHAMLENVEAVELKLEALRRFRRREMLRIGVRDLLGTATVEETTGVLSELAEILIRSAYQLVELGLRARHGVPMHLHASGRRMETGFAVIAMGKLGGRELNFSSDVDLIYVYGSEDGVTHALKDKSVESISNEEYFEYLARLLTSALTELTQEGYVFRVDLRLRAEGRMGQLARSLARYEQYYRTRGQMWERQALLKARPIAGDPHVGRAFLRLAHGFTFRPAGDGKPESAERIIGEIKSVKAMIDETMAGRGHERRNVKLGIGGIREIEFLVQAAQMISGGSPKIQDRNTLSALERFKKHRLLSAAETKVLSEAYRFLRNVEHKLQMVHDLQTHRLSDLPEELTRCAIRLGYPAKDRAKAARAFLVDYNRHTAQVRKIFKGLVDAPQRSHLLKAVRRMPRLIPETKSFGR